jgi:arylsulfatase
MAFMLQRALTCKKRLNKTRESSTMAHAKPNILLVTTDQQRFDAAGPAAPSFLRTPHFDHLCREGVRFTGARADCPICVPARVSIMTGKTVFGHGMDHNGDTARVMGREGTLPALLRDCGYQTAAIGKMHFGPIRSRHGFEEMLIPDDYYRAMRRSGHPCQPMLHGMGQNELYPAMATVPEAMTLTSWIAEESVSYIRDRRDPNYPFFLWCSFSKPHPPLDPPEPYYSMYRNCPVPDPVFGGWSEDERCPVPFVRHREAWSCDIVPPEIIREARAAYYGLITQIDYNLGRVFAALQDADIFNDTLVLYMSDHGEFLGDHHSCGKFTFHEASAHVPCVLRMPRDWPDRLYGAEHPGLVNHADVLPTLLRAAGGAIPKDCEGIDLDALARGKAPDREYMESTAEWGKYFAITDGRWKYIYYPEGASEQFFDLESDPLELRDLALEETRYPEMDHLKNELITRHEHRHSEWVEDGALVAKPVQQESTRDRRDRPWPGYHTDHCGLDVCH